MLFFDIFDIFAISDILLSILGIFIENFADFVDIASFSIKESSSKGNPVKMIEIASVIANNSAFEVSGYGPAMLTAVNSTLTSSPGTSPITGCGPMKFLVTAGQANLESNSGEFAVIFSHINSANVVRSKPDAGPASFIMSDVGTIIVLAQDMTLTLSSEQPIKF
jgi:hypothetical protein